MAPRTKYPCLPRKAGTLIIDALEFYGSPEGVPEARIAHYVNLFHGIALPEAKKAVRDAVVACVNIGFVRKVKGRVVLSAYDSDQNASRKKVESGRRHRPARDPADSTRLRRRSGRSGRRHRARELADDDDDLDD